jgi:hypothetical protein
MRIKFADFFFKTAPCCFFSREVSQQQTSLSRLHSVQGLGAHVALERLTRRQRSHVYDSE